MPKQRFKVVPAVYLILEQDGMILLMQRHNTGYQDGNYGLPSGHVEEGEHPTEALVREIKEELGIRVLREDLVFVHVMSRVRKHDQRIDLFFTAKNWLGVPTNMESEKCSQINWFWEDKLPENTIPYIRDIIYLWRSNIQFSENEE